VALSVFGVPANAGTEPTTTPTTTTTAEPVEPSPTATPEPTPTPSPSPSDTTQPAPSEPEEPPADEPAPAEPQPTERAPGDPSDAPAAPDDGTPGSGTPVPDPDEAYAAALEGAQTVAVAEAQRLLAQVLGEIAGAEQALAQATADAEAARTADEAAQQHLKVAQETAARTQREIADIVERTEQTEAALAVVAGEAYQGDSLATLGVVLAAETPDELTDRYMGMRHLLEAGDSTLGDLAEDEADLRNAQDRLDGQLEQRRQLAAEAAAARKAKDAAAAAAVTAQEVLTQKSDRYEYALSLAEQAKLEDYRLYMEMINESTALGEQLALADYGPGYGTGTFVRPGTGATTSEYGQRLHPILGYVKMHTGLDFGRGDGRIYAADAGTVVQATWNNAYGNMVVIDHGEVNGQRLTTMYAHQAGLMVNTGQRVEKGQVIGTIGSTGYSTGPHLHFEVRLDGQHTDPWPWIQNAPAPR
jgi:murein DD-endopeptidase MepM/ murein hydrolase activator NlpD